MLWQPYRAACDTTYDRPRVTRQEDDVTLLDRPRGLERDRRNRADAGRTPATTTRGRRSTACSTSTRPSIVQCRSTDDVVAAVRAARAAGLPIAVRGGGHSVAGHCVADDALVVDLRHMRAVEVDPERRIARAEGGAPVAGPRHGDRRPRPRDDRRHVRRHGDRRPDADRRDRLPDGHRRAHLRHARRGGGRDRRRSVVVGPARAAIRSCSGRCAAAAATSAS